ncbi:MAG: heme biosynthesis HemY N-terminal domain-containing protein [Woeseiaceae bacterium]|nr:heme biosynthesis HemY N-terminal domain-containing protein [Woeseiaceae bacterium]
MKFGLIIVVATIALAFVADLLLADAGYVAISIRGHLFEMSVFGLAILITLLIATLWLIRWIIVAPRRLGEAAGRYRSGRAGQKLTRGMIEVAEGNFARGEKLLARAAGTSDAPLFNYLQAARAAHLQGQDERRDDWLKLAYEETPEATNAVLLTQAEFQLDRRQYEQALATLRRIEENTGDHSYALALLGRIYFRLEDWNSLEKLLPRLAKHSRIDKATLDAWTRRVHRERLAAAADADALLAAWKNVPRRLKDELDVQSAYYEGLMRIDQHDKAEKELAAALKRDWRGGLVHLYGQVQASDASKQLRRAEGWLGKHPEDPDLLLAAARLCLRNELWGKARSYLEAVIGLRPTPDAYQEYGRLLNQLGETDEAAAAFRDGLNLVTDAPLTAIPHLEADRA